MDRIPWSFVFLSHIRYLASYLLSSIDILISHFPSPTYLPSSNHHPLEPPSTRTKCIYSYRKKPTQTSQAGTGRPSRNSPRRTACWGMILNGKSSLLLMVFFFLHLFLLLFTRIPLHQLPFFVDPGWSDADILFLLILISIPFDA
jgi:hypothetical protein